jgi:hypothetical protein
MTTTVDNNNISCDKVYDAFVDKLTSQSDDNKPIDATTLSLIICMEMEKTFSSVSKGNIRMVTDSYKTQATSQEVQQEYMRLYAAYTDKLKGMKLSLNVDIPLLGKTDLLGTFTGIGGSIVMGILGKAFETNIVPGVFGLLSGVMTIAKYVNTYRQGLVSKDMTTNSAKSTTQKGYVDLFNDGSKVFQKKVMDTVKARSSVNSSIITIINEYGTYASNR